MCERQRAIREDCSNHSFDEVELACHLFFNTTSTNLTNNPSRVENSNFCNVTKAFSMLQEDNVDHKISRACPVGLVKRFHKACFSNNVHNVKRILSRGLVDVNCLNNEGYTAVMVAAGDGMEKMFDFLMQQNCDISIVDASSNHAFHYACSGRKTSIVEKLLDLDRLNIERRGYLGKTPLMFAVSFSNIDVVRVLIQNGADLEAVDHNNDTILRWASVNSNVNVMKYLLSLNIFDIDCRGFKGRTPVMSAVQNGVMNVVKVLRQKGADIEMKDDLKNTILHLACKDGFMRSVNYALSLNIFDINCKGQFGRTPLMISVEEGHTSVVRMLIRKGAAILKVDDDGDNTFHLACRSGHVRMVKYILSLNIFDINCKGKLRRTPLMMAVEKGHMSVVKVLIRKGAIIKTVDDTGDTILNVACKVGHEKLVKYILALSIMDINSKGHGGRTPLMNAVSYGHIDVFRLLQTYGADLTVSDDLGKTLLHVACKAGQLDMVKYLVTLEELSDIKFRKDKHGDTPIQLAELNGYCVIVKYLNQTI